MSYRQELRHNPTGSKKLRIPNGKNRIVDQCIDQRSFEQPGAVFVVRVTTWFAWTLK